MCPRFFNTQNPLSKVSHNGVLYYSGICLILELDPCQSVIADELILNDDRPVHSPGYIDPILQVSIYIVVLNLPVAPDIIECVGMDTILRVELDSIVVDEGICTLHQDPFSDVVADQVFHYPADVCYAYFYAAAFILLDI